MWDNDCGQCCMDCIFELEKCLCSCFTWNKYCYECKIGIDMEEEENDKRK